MPNQDVCYYFYTFFRNKKSNYFKIFENSWIIYYGCIASKSINVP